MKKKYKTWYLSKDTINKIKGLANKKYHSQSSLITKLVDEAYKKKDNKYANLYRCDSPEVCRLYW